MQTESFPGNSEFETIIIIIKNIYYCHSSIEVVDIRDKQIKILIRNPYYTCSESLLSDCPKTMESPI